MTVIEQDRSELDFRNSASELDRRAQTQVRVRAYARAWVDRQFQWPEVVDQGRPGVKDTWRYALKGAQCSEGSAVRMLLVAWALVTIPLRVVVAYVDWIRERPGRVALAAIFYTLLAQTSWGSFLPWF